MKRKLLTFALCTLLIGAATLSYTTGSDVSSVITTCFAFGDMVGGY